MKLIKFSRKFIVISINTIFCFLITDFILTKIYRLRGYTEFFESNKEVGYINKRVFSGVFGGPLDEFSNIVNTDNFGNRISSRKICKNKKLNQNKLNKILFVGDSTLAGFEVGDNETYVSLLNQKCDNNFKFINGGVRGHDTHMSIANLKRIISEKNLDNKNTKFFYMLTGNDFKENNNKNSYFGMKSTFGSIYDLNFYQPYSNPLKLKAKELLSKNFYFLKKFRRFILLLSIENKNPETTKFENKIVTEIKTQKNCKRVIDIISSSIKEQKSIKDIYIISHPGLGNTISKNIKSLESHKKRENCLYDAAKTKRNIIVLKISDELEMVFSKRKSNLNLKFKRDSHYNKDGHFVMSEVINKLITSKEFIQKYNF